MFPFYMANDDEKQEVLRDGRKEWLDGKKFPSPNTLKSRTQNFDKTT